MAQIPTEEEIQSAQAATREAINEKVSSQIVQGKGFSIDEHSGGVIPEGVWQEQKSQGETS